MDPAAIATTLLGGQMGQQQVTLAMDMMRLNANAAKSMANMLAGAVQNAISLANVGSGVGANVNLSI
jgi:hypothetical protein